MFRKKFWCFALCTIMLVFGALPISAVELDVNGNDLDCFVENGITYVAVRKFLNTYNGYDIFWDSSKRSADVSGNGVTMEVYADKNYTVANGRCFVRKGENKIIDSTIYAPVTNLADSIGAQTYWDGKVGLVTVVGGGQAIADASYVYNPDDLYWLSRIIHAESNGEPFLGKTAVGNVVLNRVEDTRYPSNVKGVVFDSKYGVQFTPAANGTIYNNPSNESVLAAKACLEGFSLSDGALYFLNPRIAQSSWIVKNCKYEFTIGNHDFYS